MNNKIFKVSLFTLVLFLFAACDKHAFDFSHLDSVEGNGTWGTPLINAKYSVGDVISNIDSLTYLVIQDDGGLKLQYQKEFDNIIDASDYMHFDAVRYNGTQTFTGVELPAVPNFSVDLRKEFSVALPSNNVILEEAVIKSATLSLSITHDIPVAMNATISSEQVVSAGGQPLHLEYDNVQNNVIRININLDGYHVLPQDTNRLNFNVQLSFQTTNQYVPSSVTINYDAQVGPFEMHEISGKIATRDFNFSEHVDLNVDLGNLSGAITLFAPTIVLSVRNSFPIGGHCRIDTMAFSGVNSSSSLLAVTPLTLQVPVSPNTFSDQTITEVRNINYDASYRALNVAGEMVLNPEGFSSQTLTLTEDATISFRFTVTIPLHIELDNVTFRDTLNSNPMDNLLNNEIINDFTVRMDITNGLPLDMEIQLYFYNSQMGYKKALLTNPAVLMGAYNNFPVQGAPVYVVFEDNAVINQLVQCDKIFIEAKITTQQHNVTLNTHHFLQTLVTARFNTGLRL